MFSKHLMKTVFILEEQEWGVGLRGRWWALAKLQLTGSVWLSSSSLKRHQGDGEHWKCWILLKKQLKVFNCGLVLTARTRGWMFEAVSPWPLNVSGRNWELSCLACAHPVFVGHSEAMKGKEHRQCCSAGWGRCSFSFLWLHIQNHSSLHGREGFCPKQLHH